MEGQPDSEGLAAQMKSAGVDGALMISLAPKCFGVWANEHTPKERIDNLFEWVGTHTQLFPFYWIDPTEDDAVDQVGLAGEAGVMGYKCICDHFYPNDARAQRVFREIAGSGKPLLLHSGILWDGKESSRYNRPLESESLLEIPGLRFALAHMSWPWCDELVALYGKFLSARRQRPGEISELFVDTTPGTPRIYREEALRKLFTVGYDVAGNVMIGSDQCTGRYKSDVVKGLISRDTETLRKLEVSEETIAAVLGGNLRRFLGLE
jgi:predicted TIM-barrel fold metal-dependent hydrolase